MAADPSANSSNVNSDESKDSSRSPTTLAERVVLLTGATGSIGGSIAQGVLDYKNVELHVTARSEQKAKQLLETLKKPDGCSISYHIVDLSSKTSITQFIDTWSKRNDSRLDVLINNAAIVPETFQTSKETGEELQFAVNIMSYVRMANGLYSHLSKSKHAHGARIVNVASMMAQPVKYIDVNGNMQLEYTLKDRYNATFAYAQSKAADRMITKKMAQLYVKSNIYAYSCHPGVTESNVLKGLGHNSGWDSADSSAETPVFLAMSEKVRKEDSGCYFMSRQKQNCKFSNDKQQKSVDTLWHLCQNNL